MTQRDSPSEREGIPPVPFLLTSGLVDHSLDYVDHM